MKIISILVKRERLVASFGLARLVEKRTGQFELHGGTESDRTEAKEWISLFLHRAVPLLKSQIDGVKGSGGVLTRSTRPAMRAASIGPRFITLR